MSHEAEVAAAVGVFIFVFLLVFAIFLIPWIFFWISQQKAMRLTYQHHQMAPGLVWLQLIPLFNLVWQFFIVLWISKGIQAELGERGLDGGWALGLTMCILFCCGFVPFLGIFASIAGLVLWIIYWVKLAGFNQAMQAQQEELARQVQQG